MLNGLVRRSLHFASTARTAKANGRKLKRSRPPTTEEDEKPERENEREIEKVVVPKRRHNELRNKTQCDYW